MRFSRYLLPLLFLIVFLFLNLHLDAQCPMCKMSAESNLENGGTAGRGLNAGILFLLSLPYIIVGSIAYVWFKSNRAQDCPAQEGVQL